MANSPIPRRSADAGPVRALLGLIVAVVMADGLGLPLSGGHLAVDAMLVVIGYQLAGRVPRPSADPLWRKRSWVTSTARLAVPVVVAVGLGSLYWWRLGLLDEAAQRSVLAAFTFTSNLSPAFGAALSPLDHLWTLALVGQFAAAVPLLVGAKPKLGAEARASILIGLAAGVAICRLVFLITGAASEQIIMGNPLTRLDGLLLGAAVAVAPASLLRRATVNGYPLAAFAVLALLVLVAPEAADQPVASLGVLTAVAALLMAVPLASLALGRPVEGLSVVTSNFTMQWLGSRAIGIYVWYRIFGVALTLETGQSDQVDGGWPGLAIFITRVTFTLAAAATSYRYIELPALSVVRKVVESHRAD